MISILLFSLLSDSQGNRIWSNILITSLNKPQQTCVFAISADCPFNAIISKIYKVFALSVFNNCVISKDNYIKFLICSLFALSFCLFCAAT